MYVYIYMYVCIYIFIYTYLFIICQPWMGFPWEFPPRIPWDPARHLSKINSCRGSAAFKVSVGWMPSVCNLASANLGTCWNVCEYIYIYTYRIHTYIYYISISYPFPSITHEYAIEIYHQHSIFPLKYINIIHFTVSTPPSPPRYPCWHRKRRSRDDLGLEPRRKKSSGYGYGKVVYTSQVV